MVEEGSRLALISVQLPCNLVLAVSSGKKTLNATLLPYKVQNIHIIPITTQMRSNTKIKKMCMRSSRCPPPSKMVVLGSISDGNMAHWRSTF